MTLETTTNRISYTADGGTTDFATDFAFLVSTDLDVYFIGDAGDVNLQVLNSDYTVTGGAGDVGTVIFGVAPNDGTVLIVRTVNLTQTTDYVNNDKSDADVQEQVADRAMMVLQQINTRTDRSMRLPDTVLDFDPLLPQDIATNPGLALRVNATGTAFDLGEPTSSSAGKFIKRTAFSEASLAAASGEWTRQVNTGQIHIIAATGGVLAQRADVWAQLDMSASATFTGWVIGDGGVSPGGNTSLALSDGAVLLLNGLSGEVAGYNNLRGWITDGEGATDGYIIIDEYTGSTFVPEV